MLETQECFDLGITGPSLRASGYEWDLRKVQPYSGIEINFSSAVTPGKPSIICKLSSLN